MSDRHRSQVILARDFTMAPSVCALQSGELKSFLRLAGWSAIWNYAGRIPKEIAIDLLSYDKVTRPARQRILDALLKQLGGRYAACLLDAGDYYLVNPDLITYVRLGTDWDRSDVPKVLARDGERCRYCGCPCPDDLSIDHVFPRSRGGSDKPANLVVACFSCNSRKNDRTPEEARMPLLPAPKENA